MIIFDLHCADCSHRFEGWFASSSAYDAQYEHGLLSCPICNASNIEKAPMSPRVPAKSNQRTTPPAYGHAEPPIDMAHGNAVDPMKLQHLTEQLAKAQSDMLKNSEWVGSKFAEEARAIHYGETEGRSIHGEVSVTEAKALAEEGVKAAPLPFPVIPPKLQN